MAVSINNLKSWLGFSHQNAEDCLGKRRNHSAINPKAERRNSTDRTKLETAKCTRAELRSLTSTLSLMQRGLVRAGFAAIALTAGTSVAIAGCFPSVQAEPRVILASTKPTVEITYLGHSSFMIETASGTTAVTDYNGVHRPPDVPDIVTMNNAHSTHYTTLIEPEIVHALRGWGQNNRIAEHRIEHEDIVVRNVPTSVHGREGFQANSNSIFVFEIEDLCIAHLGHLHHVLTDVHLGELGVIDILMVPIDGTWTMSQKEMAAVVQQIRPSIVLPMHYWGMSTVQQFASHLPQGWEINDTQTSSIALSRLTIPFRQVVVMQPRSNF